MSVGRAARGLPCSAVRRPKVSDVETQKRESDHDCHREAARPSADNVLDPKQFDVRVTPTEFLLAADVHHSDREQEGEVVLCDFVNGPLFRSYTFPEPVDPARVSAEYRHGLLRVRAPLAQPGTKVEVQAA